MLQVGGAFTDVAIGLIFRHDHCLFETIDGQIVLRLLVPQFKYALAARSGRKRDEQAYEFSLNLAPDELDAFSAADKAACLVALQEIAANMAAANKASDAGHLETLMGQLRSDSDGKRRAAQKQGACMCLLRGSGCWRAV